MCIEEELSLYEQHTADLDVILVMLPDNVQSALESLPSDGRDYLLAQLLGLSQARRAVANEQPLLRERFVGGIAYAHAIGQLSSPDFQCLYMFEKSLDRQAYATSSGR